MMGGRLLKSVLFFILVLGTSPFFQNAFSQENTANPVFMNQFFSEQTLTVSNEGDALVPGTLRTVLIQAAGIRKNNPFTLIKIIFDPNVRTTHIIKGPLRIEGGLVQIDCGSKVTIDGTAFDSRYVDEKEPIAGILIHSSGNTLKSCKIKKTNYYYKPYLNRIKIVSFLSRKLCNTREEPILRILLSS